MYSIITQLSLISISSFISIYILFDFFNKTYSRIYKKKYIYIISFILIWLFFTFINIYSIGVLNFSFSLFIPIFVGIFLYGTSSKKDFCIILLFIISLNIMEILCQVLFSLVSTHTFNMLPGNMLQDLIIFSLYQFIMYFIVKKNRQLMLYESYFAPITVPVISIIIILVITYTMSYISNRTLLLLLLWVCISIFIADIYICFLFNKLSVLYNQKSQSIILQYEKSSQIKYYNELEKKYEEYQKLSHDIKRHIGVLENLYSKQNFSEANEYSLKLKKILNSAKLDIHTNNRIINIIVNDKISTAKKHNIKFEYNCEDTDLSFIEDIDLTIILSNLLDNAFDECISNSLQENIITLCICKINNFQVINLSNTCLTPLVQRNKRFLTTKPGHLGIGMMNVENTVQKYNGIFFKEYKNGLFTVQITFNEI